MYKPRYEYYKGTTNIVDNEVDEIVEDVVERLNFHDSVNNELLKIKQRQYEQIIDLNAQLKNAIVPKFKIGQEVWFINDISEEIYLGVVVGFEASKVYFSQLDVYYRIEYEDGCLLTDDFEDNLLATKEEAEQRLKEIKGGN